MSTETTHKPDESLHEGGLDPFAESRIMPGNWDLSSLPAPEKPSRNGHVKAQPEGDSESETGLSRQTLSDWHLEPYFDPHPRRANWNLDAF